MQAAAEAVVNVNVNVRNRSTNHAASRRRQRSFEFQQLCHPSHPTPSHLIIHFHFLLHLSNTHNMQHPMLKQRIPPHSKLRNRHPLTL